jgi:hypothetical protein
VNTQQSAFQQGVAWQQAYAFLSQGIAAKLYRDNGQWLCIPMYNTKQMIELEVLK